MTTHLVSESRVTVKPAITERITLEQVPDALARMSRRELAGKVVVTP